MACAGGSCNRCDQCGCLLGILERVRSMPEPKDEETAKVKVILPILAALGWDAAGDEVILELQVGAVERGGQGRRWVDLALAPDPERPLALLEAKGPKQDLRRFVNQVLQQAFFGTAKICVLTNGTVWWFYLPRADGQPVDRRFAELHLLDDPIEDLADDLKAFLGRTALVNGDAANRARQVLEARNQADLLTEQLGGILQELIGQADGTEPHPDLVALLRRLVYERTGLRPTHEQVAAALPGQCAEAPPCRVASSGDESDGNGEPSSPTPNRTPPTPPAPQDSAAAKLSPPSHLLEEIEILVPSFGPLPRQRPVAFILRGGPHPSWVERHPVDKYYDIPVSVAQLLCDRYPDDFLDKMQDVPRSFGNKSRAGMKRFSQVRKDGKIVWYVNRAGQGTYQITKARRFLKAFDSFGHHPDELWLIYNAEDDGNSPSSGDVGNSPPSADVREARVGKPRESAPDTAVSDAHPRQAPPPAASPPGASSGQRRESRMTVTPPSRTPSRKPSGFELWGRRYPMDHYYDIPVAVANAISQNYPDDFQRVEELGGSIISKDPTAFRAKRVEETDWYVDVSWRGVKHVTDARRLLQICGHNQDDLKLLYGTDWHDSH